MNRQTRQITLSALLIALGLVLPQLFHSIPNAGSIWAPMHIPVLLAGFVVGPVYGCIVGILTPILSSVITGMPPAAILPGMVVELAVYGLVTGLAYKLVKCKKPVNVYVSLICGMLAGRVAGGLVKAFILNVGKYSLNAWVTAYFVTALPGIVVHLIVVPVLVLALEKAGLTKK